MFKSYSQSPEIYRREATSPSVFSLTKRSSMFKPQKRNSHKEFSLPKSIICEASGNQPSLDQKRFDIRGHINKNELAKIRNCEDHNLNLDYFCFDCSHGVCAFCRNLPKHQNHSIKEKTHYNITSQPVRAKLFGNILKDLKATQGSGCFDKKIYDELTTIVESKFNDIFAKLEDIKQSKLKVLRTLFESHDALVENIQSSINQSKAKLDSFLSRNEEVFPENLCNDVVFLQHYDIFQAGLNSVKSTRRTLSFIKDFKRNFTTEIASTFKSIQSGLEEASISKKSYNSESVLLDQGKSFKLLESKLDSNQEFLDKFVPLFFEKASQNSKANSYVSRYNSKKSTVMSKTLSAKAIRNPHPMSSTQINPQPSSAIKPSSKYLQRTRSFLNSKTNVNSYSAVEQNNLSLKESTDKSNSQNGHKYFGRSLKAVADKTLKYNYFLNYTSNYVKHINYEDLEIRMLAEEANSSYLRNINKCVFPNIKFSSKSISIANSFFKLLADSNSKKPGQRDSLSNSAPLIDKEGGLCSQERSDMFRPIEGTPKIQLYDPDFQNIFRIDVASLMPTDLPYQLFPDGIRSVLVGSRLYLFGGRDLQREHTAVVRFDLDKQTLQKVCDMRSPRSYHSLLHDESRSCVYLVGGERNATCEVFDLRTERCYALPTMGYTRASSTLYLHRGAILYVFGGFKHGIHLEEKNATIERLVLRARYDESPEHIGHDCTCYWEAISVLNSGCIDLKFDYICVMPFTEDYVFLCGGYASRKLERSVTLFQFHNHKIDILDDQVLNEVSRNLLRSPKVSAMLEELLNKSDIS